MSSDKEESMIQSFNELLDKTYTIINNTRQKIIDNMILLSGDPSAKQNIKTCIYYLEVIAYFVEYYGVNIDIQNRIDRVCDDAMENSDSVCLQEINEIEEITCDNITETSIFIAMLCKEICEDNYCGKKSKTLIKKLGQIIEENPLAI